MTVSMAERRTGYHIFQTADFPEGLFYAAFDRENGTIICEAHGKTQKEALKALCEYVYRLHCELMQTRQNHRCAHCGKRVGVGPGNKGERLDPDHIIKRSKGRIDTLENLRGLCRDCHRKRHERDIT